MQSFTATNSKARIDVIDAFRGFALLGILVVHMLEQYRAGDAPSYYYAAVLVTPLDGLISAFSENLLRGKFFTLFSLLFGMSFYIQMRSAQTRNDNFLQRFSWRLLILLVIGSVHALFYRGDILTTYALLGVVLLAMRNLSNRVVILIVLAILLNFPRFLMFALFSGQPLTDWGVLYFDSPQGQSYFAALTEGGLLDVFSINAWHGRLWLMEIQFSHIARGYFTLGCFLIGMLLGRVGFFERIHELRPVIVRVLVGCLIAAPLLVVLANYVGNRWMPNWTGMIAMSIWNLSDVCATAVYLCGFVLLYQTVLGHRILHLLAPYGRTALTAYVTQSILGTWVFYHYGLGLLGELRHSQTILLAFGVILGQIVASHLWLRFFYFGPLEWLWRCGTLRTWVPLLRVLTS